MYTLGGNRELDVLLSDLSYVREWHMTGSREDAQIHLFVAFRSGGTMDRLKSALDECHDSSRPVRVIVLTHLPRAHDGSVDESTLTKFEIRQDSLQVSEDSRLPCGPETGEIARRVDLASITGPELRPLQNSKRTLADALLIAARQTPQRGIRFCGESTRAQQCSYAELLQAALRVNGGLATQGVQPGVPVVLFTEHASTFLRLAWGCFVRGNPVLPCQRPAHKLAREKLFHALARLPSAIFLRSATDSAFVADLEQTVPRVVVHDASSILEGPSASAPPVEPDQLALLLMTSGSTGTPKLVMQTHEALLAYCFGASERNALNAADVSLNWFPLDHVGGLVMFHIRDVWLGCEQLQVETDWILAEPTRWLDLLTQYNVTVSWAPNFAYGLITGQIRRQGLKPWNLSSLRVLINGGEMVVPEQAATFMQLLEDVGLQASAMVPAWGMSETCSGIVYSSNLCNELRAGLERVSVGGPIRGMTLRIVGAASQVLEWGEVGNLEVSGPGVSVGYFRDERANQAAFTSDGWFKTGDLAKIEEGQLVICGRVADKIIVNGKNFSAQEIENALRTVPGVELGSITALGIPRTGGETDQLVIVYAPTDGVDESSVSSAIRDRVLADYNLVPGRIFSLESSRIPRGPIGKVLRSELRTLIQDKLARESQRWIPGWFARPIHTPKALHSVDRGEREFMLIADPTSRATRVLVARAEAEGYRVSLSEPASRSNPIDRKELEQWCRRVSHGASVVVVVPTMSKDRIRSSLPDPALSILETLGGFLTGWHQERRTEICRLQVLGADGQSEDVAHSANVAAISAWLKSAAAEFPWLRSKVVNFTGGANHDAVKHFLLEIASGECDEEILYCERGRLVRAFESTDTRPPPANYTGPLTPDSFYVLTGGLGGIGSLVATWLLQSRHAKVLLVGRTDLDVTGVESQERRQRLQTLQSLGTVNYEVCDIADTPRLSKILTKWEGLYKQQIQGVFHLAGVLSRGSILQQDRDSLRDSLFPRSVGLQSLVDVLAGRQEAVLIGFSSINGYFGGAEVSAHAAGCAFQNSYLAEIRKQRTCYVISWSGWPGVGQGPGVEEMKVATRRGYLPIDRDGAIASLECLFSLQNDEWLVGVGPESDKLAPLRGAAPLVLEASMTTLGQQQPRTPTGSDQTALVDILKGIWSEVLELPDVPVKDNFFDLGGTSLLVPRVCEQVRQRLGIDLHTVEIFKNPTVLTFTDRLRQLLQQRPVTAA